MLKFKVILAILLFLLSTITTAQTHQNLLVNGDFSNGQYYWFTWIHNEASAYSSVQNGELIMSLDDGGSESYHVQLIQTESLAPVRQLPFQRGLNLTKWFQYFTSISEMKFKQYTRQDLENIQSLGCDHIRLPMELFDMTGPAPDYEFDPLFYLFLDQVIDWAEELGLYLILDNHSFDPDDEIQPEIIGKLLAVWTQLADHCRNRSELIYYEILNEPHTISDEVWNDMQQQVIDIIRSYDQTHTIIVSPADWGNYEHLHLMPEYDDSKLIYTFHFYDPFIFTSQGAFWCDPTLENLAGVPYPYDPARMPDLPEELIGTWVEDLFNRYPDEGNDAWIQSQIDKVVQFSNDRQVPVWCGEFGVFIPNCEIEDRVRWLTAVRTCLENNNVAWTMWEYGDGMGIFENDREMFEYDVNLPIIEALGLTAPAQSEFQLVPDTAGFIIYDDYLPQRVFSSNWNPNGQVDYYSENSPKRGDYCISWSGADKYSSLGFRFSPIHDLTTLRINLYLLELWVRSTNQNLKFDIRLLDTDTDDPLDHPWRMRFVVDSTVVDWDGTWQHIQVPLTDFTEHGAWEDNTWYEPQGLFDWSDVETFEIASDYHDMNDVELFIDNIKILEPQEVQTQMPYSGTPVQLPGTIEAENYDSGGQGVAYQDADIGNNGGQYRTDDVDIQITSDTGGGYNVGWTQDGEWLEYTVDITADTMDIEVRVASMFSNGQIKLLFDENTLGTVTIPNTGDWQLWQTVTLNDIAVATGTNKILRLEIINGNFNINWIKFTAGNSGINDYSLPARFALDQNYPNPFNSSTVIRYTLPQHSHVTLEIFNMLGEKVCTLFDSKQEAGSHIIEWNVVGNNSDKITSGIYFCSFEAVYDEQTFKSIKKMILIK